MLILSPPQVPACVYSVPSTASNAISVLLHNYMLSSLPTGSQKSLCYCLPPKVYDVLRKVHSESVHKSACVALMTTRSGGTTFGIPRFATGIAVQSDFSVRVGSLLPLNS